MTLMMLKANFVRRRTLQRTHHRNTTCHGATTRNLSGCFFSGILCFSLLVTSSPARSDEFATIPAGDPLYTQLTVVARAGLATPASGPGHALTRYEVALETAKAIFTVTTSHRADAKWATPASRPALLALRELTATLRSELKKLNVDANSTLARLDSLLQAARLPVSPRVDTTLASPSSSWRTGSTAGLKRGELTSLSSGQLLHALRTGRGGADSAMHDTRTSQLSLSQRLRVDCAVSALAREADDPFGDAAILARSAGRSRPTSAGVVSAVQAVDTGAALDLTHWLTLSAGYRKDLMASHTQSLQDSFFAGPGAMRSVNGGLAIEVRPGMTLTGSVARLATAGEDPTRATRIGGGLSLSAWQNRLSLNANLSRLVPEDSFALSSKAAELNVGLEFTQRLSLSLLYQRLFAAENQAPVDRRVGGGISIKF